MGNANDQGEPNSGFWIFWHPRELYIFENAAAKDGRNPKVMKPFYEQFYRVLRRHMDGKTRLVANCPWEYLRTCLETEVVSGSHDKGGKPSPQQLITAADYLEEIGLLERKSEKRRLIFFLKKAPTSAEIDDYLELCRNPSPGGATEEQQIKSNRSKNKEINKEINELFDDGFEGATEEQQIRSNTLSSISSINKIINKEKINKKEMVNLVFEHWKKTLNHPRAVLGKKRSDCISKAIALGYSNEQLMAAVDGCAKSTWHMGANDDGKVHDGITLIFRDEEHIERFISFNTQVNHAKNKRSDENGNQGNRRRTGAERSEDYWNYLSQGLFDDRDEGDEPREIVINP